MGIEDLKKLKTRGAKPDNTLPTQPRVDPHHEAIAKQPQEDPRNPQKETVIPRKEDPTEESPGEIVKQLGIKTMPEKQRVAEEVTQRAKDDDVTDMREETTDKGYRHDMVIPQNPTIPPSIVMEREKAGLHPDTGLAEDKADRDRRHKEAEEAVKKHEQAVKDADREREKASQLPADEQKRRDREERRRESEIDPELERDELGENDDTEEEKDADDQEAELRGK